MIFSERIGTFIPAPGHTTGYAQTLVGWAPPCPGPRIRVLIFYWQKKSRTFPRLSRTPTKNFPGPFWRPRMFKYKEKKRHLLTIRYSECSPLQKIQHEAKCGR